MTISLIVVGCCITYLVIASGLWAGIVHLIRRGGGCPHDGVDLSGRSRDDVEPIPPCTIHGTPCPDPAGCVTVHQAECAAHGLPLLDTGGQT